MSETTSLRDALAAAEAELNALSEQTKAAYRAYRAANGREDAVVDKIRELKRQIQEQTP